MSDGQRPIRLGQVRGVDPKGRFPANAVSAQATVDAHGLEFARSAADCLVAASRKIGLAEIEEWQKARDRQKP